MKIAVLSGKGGTGKTTVSTCLAETIKNCQYIDCDVEEPNGEFFLNPVISNKLEVNVKVPSFNLDECNGCAKCADVCQFNAIAVIKNKVLLFPEICHHCGACSIVCPKDAISEKDRVIGVIETNSDKTFMQGRLNIGEPICIPILNKLKNFIKTDMPVIIDCPPGASCSVVSSIEDVDFCILVTEPSPFGLHDLKIAVQLVRKINIPFGIVINKASENSKLINDFSIKNNIDILLEIPFSKEIAEAYSKGILPIHLDENLKNKFYSLFNKIEGRQTY